MSATDRDPSERLRAAFLDPEPWRAAVDGVMRHEGYTEEQIAEAHGPVVHTEWCTDNGYPFGYDCTDEEGRDQHPLHTRAAELDDTYRLFFEESPLIEAILPIFQAAQAGAWEEAMRYAIVCGNETSDSWGNLYRLDWIARMEHEIEENPYTEPEPTR